MKTLLNLKNIKIQTRSTNDDLKFFKQELEMIINNYLIANNGNAKVMYRKIFYFQVLYYIGTPIFEFFADFTKQAKTFPQEAYFEDLTKEQQQLLIKLADAVLLFGNLCIPSLVNYYIAVNHYEIELKNSVTHILVIDGFHSWSFFHKLRSFYDLPKADISKSSIDYANEIFNLVTESEYHLKLIAEFLVPLQLGSYYDINKDYREELRALFIEYGSPRSPDLLLFILLSTKDYGRFICMSEEI